MVNYQLPFFDFLNWIISCILFIGPNYNFEKLEDPLQQARSNNQSSLYNHYAEPVLSKKWHYILHSCEINKMNFNVNHYLEKGYTLNATPLIMLFGNADNVDTIESINFVKQITEDNFTKFTQFDQTIDCPIAYFANYPGPKTYTTKEGKPVYLDECDPVETTTDFLDSVVQHVSEKHNSMPIRIYDFSIAGLITIKLMHRYLLQKNHLLNTIEKVFLIKTLSSIYDVAKSNPYEMAFYKLIYPFISLTDHKLSYTKDLIEKNKTIEYRIFDAIKDKKIRNGKLGKNLEHAYKKSNDTKQKNLNILVERKIITHNDGDFNEDLFKTTLEERKITEYQYNPDEITQASNVYFAWVFYIVFTPLFFCILPFLYVADIMGIPIRHVEKCIKEIKLLQKNNAYSKGDLHLYRFLNILKYLVYTLLGWLFKSAQLIFRMVFYPLYIFHSAITNISDDKPSSIAGICLTLPAIGASIFTLLMLIKITDMISPSAIDQISNMAFFHHKIPILNPLFSWVRLSSLSSNANTMAQTFSLELLIMGFALYGISLFVKTKCNKESRPSPNTSEEKDSMSLAGTSPDNNSYTTSLLYSQQISQ